MAAEMARRTGQLGMAYRLRTAFGDQLLYVHGLGWHYWDDTRRTRDDIGKSSRAVYELFKLAWAAMLDSTSGDEKDELKKTIVRCESAAGVDAILELAQKLSGIAATADDLDRDPYTLNTLDGIVDLRTGECTPHDPAARHTKQAGVGYDPTADCPRWKAFLQTTFGGDQNLIDYMQRFLGYAAIGEVSPTHPAVLPRRRRQRQKRSARGDHGSVLGTTPSPHRPTSYWLAATNTKPRYRPPMRRASRCLLRGQP